MRAIRIGITGGIGAGKSVVAKILQTIGYPVYNADTEAKNLLATDPVVIAAVKHLFGEKAYLPDGLPDRNFISQIVFNNPEMLSKLNAIIHPAVREHFLRWAELHNNDKIIFKEAAIMFESGSDKDLDKVIVVTAPAALRIERVQKRDGKSVTAIKQIISRQMPEEELIKKSDFVMVNDETRLLVPQVLEVLNKLNT